MEIIYALMAVFLLTSCSGDETPEVLQNSFTSKPTNEQVIAFLKKKAGMI